MRRVRTLLRTMRYSALVLAGLGFVFAGSVVGAKVGGSTSQGPLLPLGTDVAHADVPGDVGDGGGGACGGGDCDCSGSGGGCGSSGGDCGGGCGGSGDSGA